jgi:hypothetical protein
MGGVRSDTPALSINVSVGRTIGDGNLQLRTNVR